MAKQLPLKHGEHALVDDDVYEWAKKYSWRYEDGYAVRTLNRWVDGRNKVSKQRLHRAVLEAGPDDEVHYLTENRLDNRRENLKLVPAERSGDLTGRRFGRLVVIKRGEDRVFNSKVGDRTYLQHFPTWDCDCDCGRRTNARADHLKNGSTTSCGCRKVETRKATAEANKKPTGESAFNQLFLVYQIGAGKRGLVWALTSLEASALFKHNCCYCGAEPSQKYGRKDQNGQVLYNGIDRVDSSRGYFPDNCVPCCGKCNYAKMRMSIEEFKAWIFRAYHHLFPTDP